MNMGVTSAADADRGGRFLRDGAGDGCAVRMIRRKGERKAWLFT